MADAPSKESPLPQEELWQARSACGPNALYCLLQIYGRPCDYDDLYKELSPPVAGNSLYELRQVAKKRSLNLHVYTCSPLSFGELTLPLIAHPDRESRQHYVLVVGHNKEHIMLWNYELSKQVPIPRSRFFKEWTGYALALGSNNSGRTVILWSLFVGLLSVSFALGLSRRRSFLTSSHP